MDKTITKGKILKYMREALRTCTNNPHVTLITETLIKMAEAGIIDRPKDNIYSEFYLQVASSNDQCITLLNECYLRLIIQGIIIPKPCPPNYGDVNSWSHYIITEYGNKWANNETEPIPEDPEEVIQFIVKYIPTIDEIVIQYISEALNTFNNNYYFASAVMLGAASEKLVYLLANDLSNSLDTPKMKDTLSRLLRGRKLFELFSTIMKYLRVLIDASKMPYEIHEDSLDSLAGLFNAMRIQRNDAVHPISGEVTIEQLRLMLLAFPHLCKKVYDILGWLKENKI